MGIIKRFTNFKGLNTRASHLLRSDEYFTDCQNVEISKKQSIIKRPGQEKVDDTLGGKGLANYNDSEELIGVGAGVYGLSSGSWVAKTNSGQNTLDTTSRASFVQDNKRLFISNGVNELMKYDGGTWYRAGICNPKYRGIKSIAVDANGTNNVNYEFALQYAARDRQGNIIESQISSEPDTSVNIFPIGDETTEVTIVCAAPTKDYDSIPASDPYKWLSTGVYALGNWVYAPDNKVYALRVLAVGPTATEPKDDPTSWQLIADDLAGFCSRSAKVSGAQSDVSTVIVDSGHDIEIGDYIFVKPSATLYQDIVLAERQGYAVPEFDSWRLVTAVTATTITFGGDANTNFPDDYIITPNLMIRIYAKTAATTAYDLAYEGGVDSFVGVQSVSFSFTKSFNSLGEDTVPEQLRYPPPKGSILEIHQGLLAVAGDDENPFTWYWSNTENKETFDLTENSLNVDEGEDGPITALKTNNDILIVFQKKAINFYYGTLGTGQVRREKAHTNGIGCVARDSVLDINGFIYFLSERGVYRVRGGQEPEEVSTLIQDLFTTDDPGDPGGSDILTEDGDVLVQEDGDAILQETQGLVFEDAIAVHDVVKQHYKLCVPAYTGVYTNSNTTIFVHDYFYDAWLKHKSMDFMGGVTFFDGTMYFTNQNSTVDTQKEIEYFHDNGSAIQAFVKTNWAHFGEPSVPKKVVDIKAYALEGEIFTMQIRSEKDWVEDTYYSDFTLTFDASTRFSKNNYVSSHDRSVRLYFENNVVNEGFELTGYELELEAPYGDKIKR